jgi:hypothetical protein
MKNIKNTKFNKAKSLPLKKTEIAKRVTTAAALVGASVLPYTAAQAGDIGGSATVHSTTTQTAYEWNIANVSLTFNNTTSQGTIGG